VIVGRRKLRIWLVVAAAVAVVAYTAALYVAGYRPWLTPPFPAVIPNASTVEHNGVRVTVRWVERDGPGLRIGYALEHVEPRPGELPIFFMRLWIAVKVEQWDGGGQKKVAEEYARGMLSPAFVDGRVRLHEAVAVVAAPATARYVTLRLGREDRTTNPVPVPAAGR
jgi:hypothetical protein